MVQGLFQDHSSLKTVREPLQRNNFDTPLSCELILFTLGVPRNEMADSLREIFSKLSTVGSDRILDVIPQGH